MTDTLLGATALMTLFLYCVGVVTVYRVSLGRPSAPGRHTTRPHVWSCTWRDSVSLHASVSVIAAGLFWSACLLTHAPGKNGIQAPSQALIAGGVMSFLIGNIGAIICVASNHTGALANRTRNVHYRLTQGMRAVLWPLVVPIGALMGVIVWGIMTGVVPTADRLVSALNGYPSEGGDLGRAERIACKEREVGISPSNVED